MTAPSASPLNPFADGGALLHALVDPFSNGFDGPGVQQLTGPQGPLMVWLLAGGLVLWWMTRRARAAGIRLRQRLWNARAARRKTRARPCRWRVGSMRMASGVQKWRCDTCGLDGFSAGGSPPSACNWHG